jgi:thiosulfate/3-mercaptopyruvate sulfurtransferase
MERETRRWWTIASIILAALLVSRTATAAPWPSWLRGNDEAAPTYPDVAATTDWLQGRLGSRGLVVVDARDRASYLAGHIPGAVSIPAGEIVDPAAAAALLGTRGLSGRGRIVCYGGPGVAPDAARMFWLLDVAGAESPALLVGGFAAWRAGGGEVAAEETTFPPVTWTGSPIPERSASLAYVALIFAQKGHEIIDTRGWDAWVGPVSQAEWGTTVRRGHIPYALPYDFSEFRGEDGALLPPEETRRSFGRVGPRPSSPVSLDDEFIIYDDGASGAGAVGYFLVRRAGVQRVRYFQGGWREWAADPDLPVVRILGGDELRQMLARGRHWFTPDAHPAGFAFFDVRHWADFAHGHLPGAVNLDSKDFADSLDFYLDKYWPDLDRASAPIVTYCYGSNCIRSRICSAAAARQGFVNVERFYGGLTEWRSVGGQLMEGGPIREPKRRPESVPPPSKSAPGSSDSE